MNTKDIQKSYKDIIDDFLNLMEYLGTTDSIEIYASFIYMLYQGYFSIKKYHYQEPDDKMIDNLSIGSYIMTGKGVCRNVEKMLRDIYNEAEYQNTTLFVYTNNYLIRSGYDNIKQSRKDKIKLLDKYVYDKSYKLYLLNKIRKDKSINIYASKKIDNSNIKDKAMHKIIGNHVLNMVSDKTNSYHYILDGTWKKAFLKSNIDPKYITSLNGLYFRLCYPLILIDLDNFKKLYKLDEKSINEMNYIISNTLKRCEENESLLNSYATSNKIIYSKIANAYKNNNQVKKYN